MTSAGAINNRHHPHHSSLPGKHPMLDRKKNNSPNSSSMKQHHYHAPAPTNSEVMRRPLKYVLSYPFIYRTQLRSTSHLYIITKATFPIDLVRSDLR